MEELKAKKGWNGDIHHKQQKKTTSMAMPYKKDENE